MAATHWRQTFRRFQILWRGPQDVDLIRIPLNFYNAWSHAIADRVQLLDPVWNRIRVRILRDNQGGYFAHELTLMLRRYYLINCPVMLFFRLLKSDFIEMRIETALGMELDYPRLNNMRPLHVLDDNGDAWAEDNVNGVVIDD